MARSIRATIGVPCSPAANRGSLSRFLSPVALMPVVTTALVVNGAAQLKRQKEYHREYERKRRQSLKRQSEQRARYLAQFSYRERLNLQARENLHYAPTGGQIDDDRAFPNDWDPLVGTSYASCGPIDRAYHCYEHDRDDWR